MNILKVREAIEKSLEKCSKGSEVRLSGELFVNEAFTGGLLSTVLRVKASYTVDAEGQLRCKTFFFKMPPENGIQAKLVKERSMFEKEALYYGRVLPMMLGLTAKKMTVPLPICYLIRAEGEDRVIVLEDLSEEGYCSPDALMLSEGLDLQHCILAMKCLGRLHGLAVAAERTLPQGRGGWLSVFPAFAKESWFYEAGEGEMISPAEKLTKKAMENLVEFSKEVKDLPIKASDYEGLEKAVKNTWKTSCQLVAGDNKINVPCHGDFYANNLMFKYKTDCSGVEIPVDVKAIDFQLTRYCHPAIDLLFFMHLCTRKSLRDHHLEHLLGVYHQSLSVTLDDANGGLPPITLKELVRDVRGKYKPFGVLAGAVSVPNLMLASDGDSKGFQDIFENACENTVKQKFRDDAKFRSRMEELIRDVVEMVFPLASNNIE